MTFRSMVTPKDTEEIKPGLFIQKKGDVYRQVYPACWEGRMNWVNFFWGGKPWKSLFFFGLILFLVWSYLHDVGEYRDFYIEVQSNQVEYCTQVFQELGEVGVKNGEQILDPFALSSNP